MKITLHRTHNDPIGTQNLFNKYLMEISNYLAKWKLLLSSGKTEFINILGRVTDTNPKIRKLAYNYQIIPEWSNPSDFQRYPSIGRSIPD